MWIPNGPETDQGARHALSLRRHMSAQSPTLDDLAAVAVDATGAAMCVISIADRTTQYTVGAFNCHVDSFPRTYVNYDRIGDFAEITRLDERAALRDHPMQAHPNTTLRSVMITGLFHQGICVGGFAVGSALPEGAFSAEHRAILAKLARVAETVIRTEVALSRMATEALSVLTDPA